MERRLQWLQHICRGGGSPTSNDGKSQWHASGRLQNGRLCIPCLYFLLALLVPFRTPTEEAERKRNFCHSCDIALAVKVGTLVHPMRGCGIRLSLHIIHFTRYHILTVVCTENSGGLKAVPEAPLVHCDSQNKTRNRLRAHLCGVDDIGGYLWAQ